VTGYPKTNLRDLLRLVTILIKARRKRGDIGEAAAGWLRGLTERYRSRNLIINLLVRRVLFVSGPELSAHVLAAPPSSGGFVAGTMKRKAMAFLAPNALTISHDAQWRALRDYNERVLSTNQPHEHQEAFLIAVRKAFARPVVDMRDIRGRMGQVMLEVVFGEGNAPEHLVDDIQELFSEVSLRTALVGSRKKAKRDRFHEELRTLWQRRAGAGEASLLAVAHDAAKGVENRYRSDHFLVEQIPHWMFTFTGSGADLLARSLAIILARAAVLDRVREERASAGPLNEATTIAALHYLEACILETGRLYPPAPQTAHRAARTDRFEGIEIPEGTELLQFFPFNNRDQSRDSLANHFRPERWLDPRDSVHQLYPNLFLSGARMCPGRRLILFINKAALTTLLAGGLPTPGRSILGSDPLPFSFPDASLRFAS
jgi:cytochrome P450